MTRESGELIPARGGSAGKVGGFLHPVREELSREEFLRKALTLLEDVGVTRATTLVVDGDYVYRSDNDKGVEISAAIEKGLAGLSAAKHRGDHVILIAQGHTEYFHVVVSLRYARKHPRHEPGIAISISAMPLNESASTGIELGARTRSSLEREILMMGEQIETVDIARQTLLKEYSESASRVFPGIRVRLSDGGVR